MKKLLFVALFAAACGGTYKQSPNASASDLVGECAYSLPDTASADEQQQLVADAESGALDVCGDQVSADLKAAGIHATLKSIDPDEVGHKILFRFQMWRGGPVPPNTP